MQLDSLSPGHAAWSTHVVDVGSGAPIPIDVFYARGQNLQPLALITAGVHGDEYEGPDAISAFVQELDPAALSGSVIAIPVANPMAFAAAQRLSPVDGRNLARSFPGQADGSPTQRLAHVLFETFARDATHLIDLHSGGVEYRFVPVAGFYGAASDSNPSYLAARRFGLQHLWRLPETDGVLSCEAHRIGKTVIGCEYLGTGQLSREGSQAYVRGIWSCLAFWEICPKDRLLPESGEAFENDWQLAESDGLFHAHRSLGDQVSTGDRIAVTTNIRGQQVQEFLASSPGVVLGLRSKAWLRKGDWGVLNGVPCRKETS